MWSWHVLNRRYEWLDGTVRIPPPTQRAGNRLNNASETLSNVAYCQTITINRI